jgi:hypothetical protein
MSFDENDYLDEEEDGYDEDIERYVMPKKINFIVIWVSINNDTYEEVLCSHPYEKLPKNVKKAVENSYDGVLEPQLDSIEIYKTTLYKVKKDKKKVVKKAKKKVVKKKKK